ncbi:MAG TPA: HNH endonuclease family protein, partial [Thermoanaerobaculia bacterium]|nr:HNH endonuclease family protein [Thermoanaerobaculia bacterium]
LNASVKNADFATKKKQAYEASDILMTQELLGLDDWTLEAIDKRQRELSSWVFGIWHFPGEEQPTLPTEHGEAEQQEEAEPEAGPEQLPEVPTG